MSFLITIDTGVKCSKEDYPKLSGALQETMRTIFGAAGTLCGDGTVTQAEVSYVDTLIAQALVDPKGAKLDKPLLTKLVRSEWNGAKVSKREV
jgi:hypothetical protein